MESSDAPTAGGQSTPVPSNVCTDIELSQIEADVASIVATMAADVDFALKVESQDGRGVLFTRGATNMQISMESASTSKWVTASIILSFLESGENFRSPMPLALDSRPQDFIGARWPINASDPLYTMTLRNLLSFTSGMTEEAACLNRGNANFEDCVITMAAANVGNGNTPGALYYYSGVHLQVAGLMAIKARDRAMGVTNSTWQNLFDDFIARTGLFTNSQYDLPSRTNPRLAGGMHWTGDDYVQFLRKTSQGQVLSSNYQRLQLSDQVGSAEIGASPANRGTGEDWRYGFGVWAECHSPTFDCDGALEMFSSAGAYGAYPFINIKHGFYGLVARQGALGTGFLGYKTFAAVADKISQWATKSCPEPH